MPVPPKSYAEIKEQTKPEKFEAYVQGLIDRLIQSGAAATSSRAFAFLSMRCAPHVRDGILAGLFPDEYARA